MRRSQRTGDDTFLQALVCGSTVKQAAAAAGISERTAYRRMEDPAFRARVDLQRQELADRSTRLLTAGGIESIKTLIALQQQQVAESVRLGAARTVLTLGLKFRESEELAQRVQFLEQTVKDLTKDSEKVPQHEFAESSPPDRPADENCDGTGDRSARDDPCDSSRPDGDSHDGEIDS
jgi:hypothetical protein